MTVDSTFIEPTSGSSRWPQWPIWDEATLESLRATLDSNRWTVSWINSGSISRERKFASEFARYNDVAHAVAVDHGSSALVIALEALGIGPDDEVVVPVLTWVATATAVLRVGAIPVMADVDPVSGCVTVDTISAVLSTRTRAVIVVHLACTVADIAAVTEMADAQDVAVIEDCAQAHGAVVNGRKVGTFGIVGTFSFQQGKVLAGGEGGMVITSNPELYLRLQELRADSRSYRADLPYGEMELQETATIMGSNYCMSEFAAAVLTDQLARLDDQHAQREKSATVLADMLTPARKFAAIKPPWNCDRRSIYEFGIQIEGEVDAAFTNDVASRATAALGTRVYRPRPPLTANRLFNPASKKRFSREAPRCVARNRGRSFAGAETYHRRTLLFHHSVLLAEPERMRHVQEALESAYAAAQGKADER